jgi:hypothetical protein
LTTALHERLRLLLNNTTSRSKWYKDVTARAERNQG